MATGSPSAPITFGGKTTPVAQCNNVYIFPALGLGVVASRARRITDGMFLAAARALAENSPALKSADGALLPALTELREVSMKIAFAVGVEAQRAGVAPPVTPERLREAIISTQWTPEYPGL